MSQHDDLVYIQDMKSFSLEVIEYTKDLTYEDFLGNRILQLAVVKLLENIGEASTKVSTLYKESHTEIPWSQIKGMRNRLVHGYGKINFQIVFNTCKKEIPNLLSFIKS